MASIPDEWLEDRVWVVHISIAGQTWRGTGMHTARYAAHPSHLQTWLIASAISRSERWSWQYSCEGRLRPVASPPNTPLETRPTRIPREAVVADRLQTSD
jgi:hypothetical protein